MMISSLAGFDRYTAAGILARAAIFIEDSGNPASATIIPNEYKIRESLLSEARKNLGISQDDQTFDAIEKVANSLDTESDILIGEIDSKAVLKRLADKGELPSDLFEIVINKNVQDLYEKKYPREKEIIEDTIRSPQQEQHYGETNDPNHPFLISLFAKHYPDKFPNRSFTMLVAGQRKGMVLQVVHAWRLYSACIDLSGVTDLIDMLKRFADKFGVEFQFGGNKGKFFLSTELPKNHPLTVNIVHQNQEKYQKKKQVISITCFQELDTKSKINKAALVVGFDHNLYLKTLKSYGW